MTEQEDDRDSDRNAPHTSGTSGLTTEPNDGSGYVDDTSTIATLEEHGTYRNRRPRRIAQRARCRRALLVSR